MQAQKEVRDHPPRLPYQPRLPHRRFIPTGPGLTRSNPIPLGETASVDKGEFTVRVNSVLFYVQLSPPPPCGCEYFAVNATLTNTSSVEEDPGSIGWGLTRAPRFPPPSPNAAAKPLSISGQATGAGSHQQILSRGVRDRYVCWTVTVNDADELVLSFASGMPNWTGPIWFALHGRARAAVRDLRREARASSRGSKTSVASSGVIRNTGPGEWPVLRT